VPPPAEVRVMGVEPARCRRCCRSREPEATLEHGAELEPCHGGWEKFVAPWKRSHHPRSRARRPKTDGANRLPWHACEAEHVVEAR